MLARKLLRRQALLLHTQRLEACVRSVRSSSLLLQLAHARRARSCSGCCSRLQLLRCVFQRRDLLLQLCVAGLGGSACGTRCRERVLRRRVRLSVSTLLLLQSCLHTMQLRRMCVQCERHLANSCLLLRVKLLLELVLVILQLYAVSIRPFVLVSKFLCTRKVEEHLQLLQSITRGRQTREHRLDYFGHILLQCVLSLRFPRAFFQRCCTIYLCY